MLLYNTQSQALSEADTRVPDEGEIAWISLIGKSPEEIQHILENVFHCHPLIIEDCVTLGQRPKLDKYDKHLLLTFFHVNADLSTIEIEHVIGPNYVITICPTEVDSLRRAREDFSRSSRYMEFSGSILYRLLDLCVDDYADVVDNIDNILDKHERAVFRNPQVRIAGDVFRLKRRLHTLRRILADEKIAMGQLSHQQFPYSRKEADVYFIDIYDHISRVLDSIDSFREAMTGLLELQLNMKSDRMNEIMKTLTIISSIFLPLTFIAGVEGMNFRIMPELDWAYGYPVILLVMAVIFGALWWFYKRKKWL